MDKKYIGKTVALPKAVAEALRLYAEEVGTRLGFRVSLSEAVAHLLKQDAERNGAATEARLD